MLNGMLFGMVNSDSVLNKIGGIVAIEKMTEIDYEEESSSKFSRVNYLRLALASKEKLVMDCAARALGSFAKSSDTLIVQSISFEIQRAIDALKGDSNTPEKMRSAILVLRECARKAPLLFLSYIPEFGKLIWTGLKSEEIEIREISASSLQVVLLLLHHRQTTSPQQTIDFVSSLYSECLRGLDNQSNHIKHGSILALAELLKYRFLKSKFSQLSPKIVALKESKDKNIKKQVLLLLPPLSRFDPPLFMKVNLYSFFLHSIFQFVFF